MWLISAKVYDTRSGSEHLSPRALDGMADHTLVVGSMSKKPRYDRFPLFGWIRRAVDAIEHLTNLATHTTLWRAGYTFRNAALFALGTRRCVRDEISGSLPTSRLLAQDILASAKRRQPRFLPKARVYVMLDIAAPA